MNRVSIKITGAQGQGVNSVGEMCAKGLKRAGYCVFGYREYMSIIKGGHSSYQLDISGEQIESAEAQVDILICFNHLGLGKNAHEVKRGGIILHQTPQWSFAASVQKLLDRRHVRVLYLPNEMILKKLEAKPILGNVLITSVVWALLGRKESELQALVREQFGHKGRELLMLNFRCVVEGFAFATSHSDHLTIKLSSSSARWKDHLLVTGSQAMGLGLIHAGCRLYAGYPMTPSSPLLSFIAACQNATGMLVKQAEDEITAAQMMSGAMFMGTRAVTATSGGGFDLMTETVSLNAIIENPSVFIVAQRPGPGTGLPTWTAQGDLLLAATGAHGEFSRIVLAVSDAHDCFSLMPTAFNLAEEWQTPVIVLTDKQLAEALFTQAPFDHKTATIERGRLVVRPAELRKLQSTDRYDPTTPDGVSPRWLPGAEAATFCAQGDEHAADGSVDESAPNARMQMEKRMRKIEAIRKTLPEPELYIVSKDRSVTLSSSKGDTTVGTLIVSWGSNKGVILDAISLLVRSPKSEILQLATCITLTFGRSRSSVLKSL